MKKKQTLFDRTLEFPVEDHQLDGAPADPKDAIIEELTRAVVALVDSAGIIEESWEPGGYYDLSTALAILLENANAAASVTPEVQKRVVEAKRERDEEHREEGAPA